MGFHMFMLRINSKWCKTPREYCDDEFDWIMDALNWMMPYNMRAYHFSGELNNPVVAAMPVIHLDISQMVRSQGRSTKWFYKRRNSVLTECHRIGEYIIARDKSWTRFITLPSDDIVQIHDYTMVPVTFKLSRAFVKEHHRHCPYVVGHKFSLGLMTSGKIIGVLIASVPKARLGYDDFTLELNRVCVKDGYFNAASKLIRSAVLIGQLMGYHRFISYTMLEESGASYKAAGFIFNGLTMDGSWNSRNRPRDISRYPAGPKRRWLLEGVTTMPKVPFTYLPGEYIGDDIHESCVIGDTCINPGCQRCELKHILKHYAEYRETGSLECFHQALSLIANDEKLRNGLPKQLREAIEKVSEMKKAG